MIEESLINKLRELDFKELSPEEGIFTSNNMINSFEMLNQDLMISHLTYPAHSVMPIHKHPELRVTFVRQGSALVTIKEKEYKIEKGDVTQIFAGTQHSLTVLDEGLSITEIIVS